MKFISYVSTLLLAYSMAPLAQAQSTTANTAIQPGSAILASLAAQHNTSAALRSGDIVADSQSAAGYQLTGEILLQLSAQADFAALAASYNLQLKHAYGDILVVATPDANIKQLLAQLAQEPTVLRASYGLRELGLSPDPQVINDPK
ncbi:hypothetical protein [Rheinheimera sp. NSM]|uniref:hypothetical protein n=1 Tax=Rheinheimera sp. NSM TaxID=3457884 RepID=UPI0040363C4E